MRMCLSIKLSFRHFDHLLAASVYDMCAVITRK